MAENPGTLESAILAIGKAFAPLEQRLKGGAALELFGELGLRFPSGLLADGSFAAALTSAVGSVGALAPIVVALEGAIAADDLPTIVSRASDLTTKVTATIAAFDTLASALSSAGAGGTISPGDAAAFAGTLATKLVDYVLITYLDNYHAVAAQLLRTIGVVQITAEPGVPSDDAKPAHYTRSLVLSRLSDLTTSPAGVFRTLYGWNDPGFDGRALIRRIYEFLYTFGFPAIYTPLAVPPTLAVELLELTTDAASHGLRATLAEPIPAFGPLDVPLTAGGVVLELSAAFALGPTAGIVVKPPFQLSLATAGASGNLSASIAKVAPGEERLLIVGARNKSRLDAQRLAATLATQLTSGTADIDVILEAKTAHVVIDLGEADGFLTSVISAGAIDATFDAAAGWSSARGLFFRGSANLATTLPLHVDQFGISLSELHLGLSLPAGGFALETSVTGAVTLGPFELSVDRIGATTTLKLARGNLGPLDIAFGFKPPNGLGIKVDAGLVAGGGYISFDSDKGRYSGVFELALADIVTVKVIGILDTKYPDGTSGFSFLLVITFDLPPIQLGFGFTLNGVGGVGGINRSMSPDALRAGLRAHRLDSVLFPPDPLGNAPQIISDLSAYFPAAKGRYLFGPMVSIGWGTPTLIDLEIGIILEVPDPVRIALLGLIKCALPAEEAALIELHIDVLGILDFGAKTLTIEGSMYDSRLVIFSVYGGMALMLDWGEHPNFAFSAGGLNPRFQPPAGFPKIDRLTVSIGDGDNPRLSSSSYFAVTSNSVQFGANVDLYAEAAGFSVHGWVGFDTLFILSPFSFVIDFSAGLDLEYDGDSFASIRVDGMLAGPTPWHVHGDASLHILFVSIGVTIDVSWGDDHAASLPPVEVLATLVPALQDARSWSAALPDGTAQAVSLKAAPPGSKDILVHPMGSLTVRENIVPLDLPITKLGNAKPSDGNLFSIQAVTINAADAEPESDLPEHYAIGAFTDLSDADKITAEAYQLFHSGKVVNAGDVRAGTAVERDVVYDEKYIDDYGTIARFSRYATVDASVYAALGTQSAGFRSSVKTTGPRKYVVPGTTSAVATSDVAYVVASTHDLSIATALVPAAGVTQLEATLALRSHVAANPQAAGAYTVMPLHEVFA